MPSSGTSCWRWRPAARRWPQKADTPERHGLLRPAVRHSTTEPAAVSLAGRLPDIRFWRPDASPSEKPRKSPPMTPRPPLPPLSPLDDALNESLLEELSPVELE